MSQQRLFTVANGQVVARPLPSPGASSRGPNSDALDRIRHRILVSENESDWIVGGRPLKQFARNVDVTARRGERIRFVDSQNLGR